MKTMTCKERGGTCDQKLSAATWDEMIQTMTKHVMDKHPTSPGRWRRCTRKIRRNGAAK